MKKRQTILITGAAGYIGSHTIIELVSTGFDIVALDNLSNSHSAVIGRLQKMLNLSFPFYEEDIRNQTALRKIFKLHKIDAVVHFANLKSVDESLAKPLLYYDNNVSGTLTLLQMLEEFAIKKFIFSSSAAVYGNAKNVPIGENSPLMALNPYGETKIFIEKILQSLIDKKDGWRIASLRYFNPVGAHESGLIGEDPISTPRNLMPYITQVAIGRREKLYIFGNDWPTPDGTPIRDYIHVCDLANGHVNALRYLFEHEDSFTVNLGTGCGISVLEMVNAFERVNNCRIPYEFAPRRPGDTAICYAKTDLARKILGWQATRDINAMCKDAWAWQVKNPNGFKSALTQIKILPKA